ncbi:unknown protein [Microcystis aeruginosa NIES-843]|uniref:Uncharacterized protein n=1 Tax=Microcystis aeruginosa (strain NIES-843 / IAM M-2473) TaxID=449447 RepID=B0JLR6_MICAN|nr:unknown protein [Microcystis aeruginosa NIES-843]
MTSSKSVKPYTPHPTPHTLPPGKTFSPNPRQRSAIKQPHPINIFPKRSSKLSDAVNI